MSISKTRKERLNMENKRKHLDFIQNVITRMAGNLFFLRGWTITLVAALFAYIVFQYKYAFISPALVVSIPKEQQVFTSSDIAVLGKTDQNATVSVNNTPISVDQNGAFKKTISLFSGKQIITIKAINRFGKETTINRQIEVKLNQP